MRTLIIVAVVAIVGVIVITQSLYVVDETEQVILLQFGEVKSVKKSSGLYAKIPFVQRVETFDRRVLRIDAPPERMLDKDINILEIDAYARYKILNPVDFRKTLSTPENARRVIGQRINAALRAQVADRSREEIIGGDVELDDQGNPITDSEGNSVVIPTESRTQILDVVLATVKEELQQEDPPFGIEMLDVRIKRADFPGEVSGRIFERMRSDREKIARQLRAEGEEEARRRRARADRDVEIILAEADRGASVLRGEGEAQAIRILADALEEDPEFFAFRRSLEAYRQLLNQGTTVILSADSEVFRFLDSPGSGSTSEDGG